MDRGEDQQKNHQRDPTGAIKPLTRLILTNAVYFYAPWAEQFNKNATSDQPFHLSPSQDANVPTMRRTANFGYAENPDYQMIELPYSGGENAMLILLPKTVDGLTTVEAKLSAKDLSATMKALQNRRIDLSLPKFKFEWETALPPALERWA